MTKNKRLFLYKLILIVAAFVLLLFPSASSRLPQIDSRATITALGIDDSAKGIELTASIAVAKKEGESGGKEAVASAEGKSMGEAISNLSRAIGKKTELAHCGLIAIGTAMCEKGVGEIVNYLVISGVISDGASLINADGKAKDLIETSVKLSGSTTFSLNSFIAFAGEDAQIPMVSLVRFASDNNSVGKSAYLPVVKMGTAQEQQQSDGQGKEKAKEQQGGGEQGGDKSGKEKQGGSDKEQQKGKQDKDKERQGGSDKEKQSGGEQGGNKEEGKNETASDKQQGASSGGDSGKEAQGKDGQIISSDKTLIFKNYKAATEFDKESTFALAWLDPQSDRGQVLLSDFHYDGRSLGDFTFRMRKKGVSVRARFEEDKPAITVKVYAKLEPEDSHRIMEKSGDGHSRKELLDALRIALSEKFDEQIRGGFDKAKQAGVDPFKYGYALFKKSPKQYEKYADDIQKFLDDVQVDTNVQILLI